jgi:hypothetical protein
LIKRQKNTQKNSPNIEEFFRTGQYQAFSLAIIRLGFLRSTFCIICFWGMFRVLALFGSYPDSIPSMNEGNNFSFQLRLLLNKSAKDYQE